jgi:MFS family permease
VLSTYGVAFGTAVVGLQRSFLLNLLTITIVVMLVTVPLFGVLGDRFGARRVFWILTALTGVGGLFALPLVATASTPVIWVTYVVQLSVFYAGASAVLPAYLAELLPVDVRFTGVSLCFQLANALGNGFAPLIMVLLVTASGGRTLTASLVVGVLCAISVVAVLVSRPAQATIGKPDFG